MAQPPTLLVIGQSGQLARELAAHPPEGFALSFAGRDRFDLGRDDPLAMLEAVAPVVVINAGGFTAVDAAEAEPERAIAVNADGPGRLARRLADLDIPLVHVSTDYVFDGLKGQPYTEDDLAEPVNAYGRSKLAGEVAVLESGAAAAVVRTSWVFGAYGTNFLAQMLRLIDGPEEARIVSDQRARPTWARDLATGLGQMARRLVEGDREALGLFHLTGADDAGRIELAEAIFAWAARSGRRTPRIVPVTTAAFAAPAVRPLDTRLDCAKIAHLGIEPQPWREQLERCLADL